MKSNAAVSQYYKDVSLDYRLFWNLDRSMAIRIGLWDQHTRTVAEALRREDQFLAEEVGITSKDHILDAGCGVGGSAIYLAKTYGCRVTGITQSYEQVVTANQNAKRHRVDHLVNFMVRDFHNTHFAPQMFDVVWAVESLSHTPRKRYVLGEFIRILKPGGRLIGADYFSTQTAYDRSTTKLRERVLDGLSFSELEYHSAFRAYLRGHGFEQIDFFDVTHMALPSARRFKRLAWWGSFVGGLLRLMGLRTKAQNDLLRALRSQHDALQNGIHQYRIFCADKPLGVVFGSCSQSAGTSVSKEVCKA